MKKRVLMAMSGGIDSSVAAMLLLEQNYELVGATFRTFDHITEHCLAREKGCCSIDSIMEAKNLAAQLGFEHHIVDARDLFRRTVIADFITEYINGRTPNPCVICNPIIKWGLLLDLADTLHCDYLATGHYAQILETDNCRFIQRGLDKQKDQSYFLWKLSQAQLQRTLFPLGGLTKTQVRELAATHGYVKLSQKKESEDICFVTDNNYRNFLRQEVPDLTQRCAPGNFITADGRVIGRHSGLYNYTIGQRKGLGVALGRPIFVARLCRADNSIVLADREDLFITHLTASQSNIPDMTRLQANPQVMAYIRYRSEPIPARVRLQENMMQVEFAQPVWGVMAGQSIVLYQNDCVVGGGIIEN